MTRHTLLEPELLFLDGALVEGHQIEIDDESGLVARVGRGLGTNAERLPRQALLPGMVNAHSHAFQRGLRGRAERYPRGSGNFWSWREEMYRLASDLEAPGFRALCRLAFREMLRCGITTVGEFHYLHHSKGARDYALDREVLAAAREAGIRIALLDVCYLDGEPGRPLEPAQERFGSDSVESFLGSAEVLSRELDPRTETLGLVAHSLRAVPIEAAAAIHETAKRAGRVFHVHVEEQPREIESVVAHYGRRPLELLLERLEPGPELTAVHCTHSTASDLEALDAAGSNVCVCPLTEANLADGLPPEALAGPDAHLSLGTDSNLRIDFPEEMRLLEHGQRLTRHRRGVFADAYGSVASRLFTIATSGGARSLGLGAGRLEPGSVADFFTLDLDAPALAGVAPEDLLAAFVFGADGSVVRRVAVSGRFVV